MLGVGAVCGFMLAVVDLELVAVWGLFDPYCPCTYPVSTLARRGFRYVEFDSCFICSH